MTAAETPTGPIFPPAGQLTPADWAHLRMRCLELGATLRGSTRYDRADLGLDAEASPRAQVVAIARQLEAYVLGEETG